MLGRNSIILRGRQAHIGERPEAYELMHPDELSLETKLMVKTS